MTHIMLVTLLHTSISNCGSEGQHGALYLELKAYPLTSSGCNNCIPEGG